MSADEYMKGRLGGVSNDPSNSSYQLGQAERIAYNPNTYYNPNTISTGEDTPPGAGTGIRLPRWFKRVVTIGVVGAVAGYLILSAWDEEGWLSILKNGLPVLVVAGLAQMHPRSRDMFEHLCLWVFWIWAGLTALQSNGLSL